MTTSPKFQCLRCNRTMCSKQSLDKHQSKNLPCDFRCGLCPFKGKNRHRYYRHMKEEHREAYVPKKKKKKAQVAAPAALAITPMEDYRTFVIEDDDIQISIRAKTLEGKKRLQALFAGKAIGGIMQALKQLDSGNDEYLKRTLTSLLPMVHSQPGAPELHSVCMSDIARRSVSFYSRSADEAAEECSWVAHPMESSMHVLTQHAKDLFSCLLQAGMAALVIQVWKGSEAMLTLNTGERTLVIRYDRDDDSVSVRQYGYDPKDFTPCPESWSEEAAALLAVIERRKEQVLQLVKNAIPEREQLRFFLNHGRPVCYPTFVKTQS